MLLICPKTILYDSQKSSRRKSTSVSLGPEPVHIEGLSYASYKDAVVTEGCSQVPRTWKTDICVGKTEFEETLASSY